MMNDIMRVLLGLMCASLLYGLDTTPIKERISEVSAKDVSFPAGNLKVGQSGIVITHKEGYNVIIANVLIAQIQDNIAYAKYTPFTSIEQKYLPTPMATPKEGDEVLFGGFYNKAIVIAPDQMSYNQILAYNESLPPHNQTHFLHIDMFAAFLAKDGINDPKPKHLSAFCSIYSVGLVYIFASNGVNVLDCQSFSILEVLPFEKPQLESTQAPFFSRIPNIDTGSLASKLRSKQSRQYFSYYDNLLGPSLKLFEKLTGTN